jgi:hypothetical protein
MPGWPGSPRQPSRITNRSRRTGILPDQRANDAAHRERPNLDVQRAFAGAPRLAVQGRPEPTASDRGTASFGRSTSPSRSSPINRTDTLQRMHCPYCSAPLVEATGGELQCSSAGSLFSISVREQFETLMLEVPVLPCELTRFNLGRWFCPCCENATNNGVCAKCGPVIISRLARQLLELNPHERN